MGQRGPQPTPTKLRLVTGNPGKRPINKKEVKPKNGLLKPATIRGDAAKEWQRAVAAMPPGFFTAADVPVLTVYCEALVMRRDALAIVANDGMTVQGSMGQTTAHPMIAVAKGQAEIILKAADRLGMSPAARTRLDSPDEEEQDDTEALYFG